MQKRHWIQTVVSLIVIRSMVLTASAQDVVDAPAMSAPTPASSHAHANRPGANRGGYSGFQHRLEQAVGLSPEQRDAVRGLLTQQHEELRTLREGIEPKYAAIQDRTDSQIRALLNPEQQKKFDTFLTRQKEARNTTHRHTS